jgi:hypothetical protein
VETPVSPLGGPGAVPPLERHRTIEPVAGPQEEIEPAPLGYEDDLEEIGRPEGPLEERHVDPFAFGEGDRPGIQGHAAGGTERVETGSGPEPMGRNARPMAPPRIETATKPQPEADEKSDDTAGKPPAFGRRSGRGRSK